MPNAIGSSDPSYIQNFQRAAFESSVISGVVSALLTGSIRASAGASAIAFLAVNIDAAVTPLFRNYYADKQENYGFFTLTTKNIFVIVLAGGVTSLFIPIQISLWSVITMQVMINLTRRWYGTIPSSQVEGYWILLGVQRVSKGILQEII